MIHFEYVEGDVRSFALWPARSKASFSSTRFPGIDCTDQFDAHAQELMEYFLLKILPAYIQENSFDPRAEHQASTAVLEDLHRS